MPAEPTFDASAILHEDEELLVINKPSGTVVHRGWADDCPIVADWVRAYLSVKKVHPVHRLDRGTSGPVVFAKSPTAARRMNDAFGAGEVTKTYVALVRGVPAAREGLIDHAIARQRGGPRVEARTRWELIGSRPTEPRHLSLVRAFPETGRLHQIRRHLKHMNHPVIGDANYGKGALNRDVRRKYGLQRLALHAERLVFPTREGFAEVHAPVPDDLSRPLLAMGFVQMDGSWSAPDGSSLDG